MEDLTFVDHTDDAGYLEQVRNKLVEKEEVTSIDDLVDKVLKKVPERDCIGGLNLIGHAGAGTFGVGSGRVRTAAIPRRTSTSAKKVGKKSWSH